MPIRKLALAIAALCTLTACSSRPAQPIHPVAQVATPTPPPTPTLTRTQGAAICNDLQVWWKSAVNEDTPRLDGGMQSNKQLAQGTQLGDDLSTLDDDLQTENSVALMPGPPGDPGDMQILTQDCAAYGVTLSWQG